MPKVKDKERILKAAREKQRVTYKGVPIRLSAGFSKETLQVRRDRQEVFKVCSFLFNCHNQAEIILKNSKIQMFKWLLKKISIQGDEKQGLTI